MSKKKDPAFLWYCTAWLQSERVRSMTLAQRGAYADLLSFGWLHGSIPADPRKLAGMLGGLSATEFESIWCVLGECWSEMPGNPGRLINERQEQERVERQAKAEELRSRGQAGGRRSAEQRGGAGPTRREAQHEAGDEAGDEAEHEAKPKPSTSTSTSNAQKDGGMDGGFGSYKNQNGEGAGTRQPRPALTGEAAIAGVVAGLAPSARKAREAGCG